MMHMIIGLKATYRLQVRVNASQVIRLIGLLLVFASQKIVHNVRNEMAESIVPLRKKITDSLTRQGMWNIRGLHKKGLAEREEKERVLSSERALLLCGTQTSLDSEKEHAPHIEQQHRNTCHSGHFHRARWRNQSREYELASETCSHSS